jgi:hypothetical protein
VKHSLATIEKMRDHRRGTDLVAKFWNRVDKNGPIPAHVPHLGPCWVWTGRLASKKKFRYGIVIVGGKEVRAHRFAWELAHSTIPEGLCVLHRCDRANCIREEHLFLGTKKDNNLDRDSKNRQASCEKNNKAKLTAEMVSTIRWSYTVGGLPVRTLSNWYEVAYGTIWRIVHNTAWRLPLGSVSA